MTIIDLVIISSFLFFFSHFGIFLLKSRMAKVKLLAYLAKSRGILILDKEYKKLIAQYTSVVSIPLVFPFPDPSLYKNLYNDEQFDLFVKKINRERSYFIYALLASFIILMFSCFYRDFMGNISQ